MKQFNLRQIDCDPSEPMFTIGFAARKIGVSPETLRLYEKEGLLITFKTPTGRRLYSPRDLAWIACIRRQINENKLNIAGIKRLLALIPCWEIKPCAEKERKKCPAYLSNNRVCWEINETPLRCAHEDCRLCKVYLTAANVGHLKELFKMTKKD